MEYYQYIYYVVLVAVNFNDLKLLQIYMVVFKAEPSSSGSLERRKFFGRW